MLSASRDQSQFDIFSPILKSFINPKHPVRLMVSLLLLKQMYGHGDESLPGVWAQNPYHQYFSGMDTFQWRFSLAPSDLSHFRKRLGPEGMERIFGWSVALHGGKAHEKTLCVDTTVQETINFPTDAKLYGTVMQRLRSMAKGKAHKKYEFGQKVSLAITANSQVVVGATMAEGMPIIQKLWRRPSGNTTRWPTMGWPAAT